MTNEKKTRLLKPMIFMLLFTGILFGGIFIYKFYVSQMMTKSMKESGIPPIAVSAITIPYESWQPTITATATVRAISGVDVTSEVTGLVKTIKQDAGKDVKVDEVLVELTADVEIARLHSLKADAKIAEITYKRDKAQYAFQGVSKATLDTDEANLKSITAQVVGQEAVVAKKTIRAPFSGRLGIINVSVGQYINPGDNIVTLQSLDPIYVDFVLPQQEFPKVKKNQSITFTTDIYPGETFRGKITSMNSKVDMATRTLTVEATIENLAKKLLPGIYGVIKITISSPKDYLTLPQTAISYNPYGNFVYLLRDEKKDKEGKSVFVAKQKFVTVGETRGDQIQILKGVKEGERIVTAGQLKLKNGSLVFINNKVPISNEPHPILKERREQ